MEKTKKPTRHVIAGANGRWAVTRSGAARASRVFDRKQEAITYARSLARKEQTRLYIHNRSGQVLQRSSYGHVPTSG